MSLRNRNMHKDVDIYSDDDIFRDRDIFSNIDRGIGKGKSKVGRACPKVDEKLTEDELIEVPLKLLHEGEGHGVTVELKNGDVCRGTLIESENNWTSQLETATFVFRKIRQKKFSWTRKEVKLDSIFIRGRRIKFIVFPHMLQYSFPFKSSNSIIKEGTEEDLIFNLRLLYLTNYSQKMALDQGQYYM